MVKKNSSIDSQKRKKIKHKVARIEWIDVDPEEEWLCRTKLLQHKSLWLSQLDKEKNVHQMLKTIYAIPAIILDSSSTYEVHKSKSKVGNNFLSALWTLVTNNCVFYGVRAEACMILNQFTNFSIIFSPENFLNQNSSVDLNPRTLRNLIIWYLKYHRISNFPGLKDTKTNLDSKFEPIIYCSLLIALTRKRRIEGKTSFKAIARSLNDISKIKLKQVKKRRKSNIFISMVNTLVLFGINYKRTNLRIIRMIRKIMKIKKGDFVDNCLKTTTILSIKSNFDLLALMQSFRKHLNTTNQNSYNTRIMSHECTIGIYR
eukprot:gnl/TRDRNA2_/TRDRNA2_178091_c2_seq2.p1 gnl/TRDRNA2_/TRDRNA2_178091_c2~~gnl/TRDRNA2_/TRDRNA2_178091_c2_seq2.p1  ORF type:complete len:316 (+),score=-23.56 gnl/TRDRNA2_/TRDRNA2_178091_c2_seq2:97-1044(+)